MGSESDLDRVRFPGRITQSEPEATPGRTTAVIAAGQSFAPAPARATAVPQTPATQIGPVSPNPQKPGIWGAHATLRPPDPARTGNDYVDKGTKCEGATEPVTGCFLDSARRDRMIESYHGRVLAAQGQYVAALTDLRVDELLKKDPEKVDIFMEILLDVASVVVSSSIKSALKLAMEVGEVAAKSVTEDQVMKFVSPFLGVGKKIIAPAKESAKDTKKAANVSYLDSLKDQSMAMYEGLREGALAGIGDGPLLVLFESFRGEAHTVSIYKDRIAAKLTRFEDAGLRKLGTKKNETASTTAALVGAHTMDAFAQRDTKAFWVAVPGGKRLALYARGHEEIGSRTPDLVGYRDKTPDEMQLENARSVRERPFELQSYVPTEFVSTAIAMHHQAWGAEPEDHPFGLPEMQKIGSAS